MAARLRTLLLVYALVVAATPFGFLFLQGHQSNAERQDTLEAEVAEDARRAATFQQRASEDLQRALELLARLPAVADAQELACEDLLEAAAAARREVQALWRTDAQDRVVCSSRGLVADLSQWPPVASFRQQPGVLFAPHAIDPATNDAVLPMALRLDDGGLLIGSLSLAAMHQRMEALAGPDSHVLAVDAAGRPVASNLGLAGHEGLLQDVADGDGPWRYRTGGVERLYAAVPIAADGDPASGLLVVGEPTAALDAQVAADERGLWWAMAGVAFVAVSIATILADVAFLRPVRRMAHAIGAHKGPGALRIPLRGLPAEWQELAGALEEATTRLERMERDRQALLNHVAHQLRTPLTPLFLRMDLARMALERGDTEALRKALGGMQRPIEDLAQKARKLDAVGGLLLGTRVPEQAHVPAAAILRDVARMHARRAASRRVALDVEDPQGTPVWADPALATLGLAELVENALNASPPGASVVLAANRDGSDAVFTVRDSGPGVAPDVLQRLLEPVWAWELPGERSGLGVGVLIARMVAEAHRGRLEAHSLPEGGASFALRLPDGPGAPGGGVGDPGLGHQV